MTNPANWRGCSPRLVRSVLTSRICGWSTHPVAGGPRGGVGAAGCGIAAEGGVAEARLADRRMSADRVTGDLEAPNRATGAGCTAARGIPFVVAIDGLAGSGKSSVSREVATRLGFGVLDTGAVYRAFAWHASTAGVDFTDEHSVLHSFD